VDLVLLDVDDPGAAAGQVEACTRKAPLVPVLVLTRRKPEGALLLELGRVRAYDVVGLADPGTLGDLLPRVEGALARGLHRRTPHPVGRRLLGGSHKMSQVRRYLKQAASSGANVLLIGETGTGKELAARAIHEASRRRGAPFVAVNCAAVPETLLESELFGHEKGAFTGADRSRRGAFELAEGGTIFLDEVGDMPASFQAKLLRVLQPPPGEGETVREFRRVGGESHRRADVRVVAATNADLEGAVQSGRFRKDLYERLNVLVVFLPPLRERLEDIPELLEHFLERFCKSEEKPLFEFDPAAMEVLRTYPYPTNVRELEGAVRSIVTMKEAGATIVLGDLPLKFFESADELPEEVSPLLRLEEVERAHLERVLAATGGNKARAARILGISRPTLDRKITRYGIQPKRATEA
jgi:transcriptional regulator with PAS, ATPase and Fis domain